MTKHQEPRHPDFGPGAPLPVTNEFSRGVSENRVREMIGAMVGSMLLLAFPVGTVVSNTTGVNPGTYLGGTWAQFAPGRAIVGFSGAAPFDVSEATLGAATHNHTYTDVISHNHNINVVNSVHSHTVGINTDALTPGNASVQGSDSAADEQKDTSLDATNVSASTDPPGGSVATGTTASTSTLSPSIVAYYWKRTA